MYVMSSLKSSVVSFSQNTTHIHGRWEQPTSTVLHSTNSLSNTQWSTWAKSAKALWRHYAQISEALHNISNDVDKKQETQTDAHALCASLDILNVAFMAYLTGSRQQICNYRKLTLIFLQQHSTRLHCWNLWWQSDARLKALKGKPWGSVLQTLYSV